MNHFQPWICFHLQNQQEITEPWNFHDFWKLAPCRPFAEKQKEVDHSLPSAFRVWPQTHKHTNFLIDIFFEHCWCSTLVSHIFKQNKPPTSGDLVTTGSSEAVLDHFHHAAQHALLVRIFERYNTFWNRLGEKDFFWIILDHFFIFEDFRQEHSIIDCGLLIFFGLWWFMGPKDLSNSDEISEKTETWRQLCAARNYIEKEWTWMKGSFAQQGRALYSNNSKKNADKTLQHSVQSSVIVRWVFVKRYYWQSCVTSEVLPWEKPLGFGVAVFPHLPIRNRKRTGG